MGSKNGHFLRNFRKSTEKTMKKRIFSFFNDPGILWENRVFFKVLKKSIEKNTVFNLFFSTFLKSTKKPCFYTFLKLSRNLWKFHSVSSPKWPFIGFLEVFGPKWLFFIKVIKHDKNCHFLCFLPILNTYFKRYNGILWKCSPMWRREYYQLFWTFC